MNTRNAPRWIALIVLAAALTGCGRSVIEVENPTPIAATDYDRVFDLSIQALRDMNFVVDRQDRRFGVITTQPLTAASAVEPWYADNTTSEQVAEATLNLERRQVRVMLEPADGADAHAATPPKTYLLRVEVTMDRRQMPSRQLTTAVTSQLQFQRGVNRPRAILTEAGVEEAHWRPMGRDPYLESRVLADVLRRADEPVAPPVTQPAETPAESQG